MPGQREDLVGLSDHVWDRLHIADELIHHTAEAALLRDLFAGDSVRS